MRLLKSNLEELSNNLGIQTPNITFPQLPNDNRLRLVPKDSENEKQIMYKEGDKMRIPGVLDYTGAKYPFKKVRKGEDGLNIPYTWGSYAPVDFTQYPNPESGYSPDFSEFQNYDYLNVPVDWRIGSIKTHPGKNISINENGEFQITAQRRSNTKEARELGNFFRKHLLGNETALTSLYEVLNPDINAPQVKGTGKPNTRDTLNNRLKKLKMLFEWSGNPTFDTKDTSRHYGVIAGNRAHISPKGGTIGSGQLFGRIGNAGTTYLRGENYEHLGKLITELSHHYQVNNPVAKKFGIDATYFGLIGGDIKDHNGENGYEAWGRNEFNAHEIIEKAMFEFVMNPKWKTEKDFVNLLGNSMKTAAKEYYTIDNEKRRQEYRNIHNLRTLNTISYGPVLKKGGLLAKSGIKIKKKNRGKFTDYCGGNVTQECINKAKKSGNKTLIKRATFAENARHFKHKSGGQIVQEFKINGINNGRIF